MTEIISRIAFVTVGPKNLNYAFRSAFSATLYYASYVLVTRYGHVTLRMRLV